MGKASVFRIQLKKRDLGARLFPCGIWRVSCLREQWLPIGRVSKRGERRRMKSKKRQTGKRGAKRLKKSKKLVATKPLRMSGAGEELPKES